MLEKYNIHVTEYFAVLKRMRNRYPRIHDQYLLLAMLILEDYFEDHILNIAEDDNKLFHFTAHTIRNLENNHAN